MTTRPWQNDEELFATIRAELFTAVVGDILDLMGFTHQFLPPTIRPLHPDMTVVGRAMPVLEADVFAGESEGAGPLSAKTFGLMLEALDALQPGEVYLATGSSPRYALWGELMSTRAQRLGCVGAVLDGYTRDMRGILRLGFPVFCYGSYAQDQRVRGKVIDFRVPVEVGGARVEPGDLILGDVDGVLVVPRAAEEEAIRRALEKVRTENAVRTAIEKGMSASEAFRTFGVM